MKIDLHAHSKHSDGTETIAEIFSEAQTANISVLAITDHDSTAGWEEARAESSTRGITFVPGIELTTESPDGHSVHVLAYLPDPNYEPLISKMNQLKIARWDRALQFISNLQREFEGLTIEGVVGDRDPMKVAIGKPHLADALIALGFFPERDIQFKTGGPLHKHSDHYVEVDGIPVIEAIGLIRAAGGVPILAHPLATSRTEREFAPSATLRTHFLAMIKAGLAGFEIDHRDVGPDARIWLGELAQEFDLITTGSSDYHGVLGKPNKLGENTTSLEMLKRIESQASGSKINWV